MDIATPAHSSTNVKSESKRALWSLSARELTASVARGEVRALEVVNAHIARIEAVNPALNALVISRFDEARAEAKEADRRQNAGEPLGPLHGLPITIKECIDVKGTPSSFGVTAHASSMAEQDEVHVARLRNAGAIVLGKSNLGQMLLFVESDNPVYGRSNHPLIPDRSPGGSSGGEGALIAAQCSPLGLGTDIGGSSRIPAAMCGTFGFKATTGRMPDSGRGSIPIGQQAITSQIGVLARNLPDLALGFEVAHGGREPVVEPPRPLGDWRQVRIDPLRIGFYVDDGMFPASAAVRRAVEEAASALEERGAQVVAFQPPDLREAAALFFGILSGDGFAGEQRFLGTSRIDRRLAALKLVASASAPKKALLRSVLRLTGRGESADNLDFFGKRTTDEHWQLVEQLMAFRERFLHSLDQAEGGPIDVLISPGCGLPAIKHGATEELGVIGAYTLIYNVLGYPAGVVPWTLVRAEEETATPRGRDRMDITARETEQGSAGLPVAVQVAARPWRDHVALGVMAALEEAAELPALSPRV